MFKLFPYSGNKLWFVNQFNELTKNAKTIIEPFAGSAAISLNSNADNIYINDFDKNIFKMFNAVKNSTYEFYKHTLYSVKENFGDIKESKESYYEYRNWFNKNFYNNESVSSNYTAGIHLLIKNYKILIIFIIKILQIYINLKIIKNFLKFHSLK